jgi:drug/metabolite transporter (DMT)-like permease
MMSTPILASTALIVVGIMFGALPFMGAFRAMPRWIRIALLMIALSFFGGGALGLALYLPPERFTPRMHHFVFLQVVLIVGMGVGIFLLLLVSGEYVKALRELDAAKKARLRSGAPGDATQNV